MAVSQGPKKISVRAVLIKQMNDFVCTAVATEPSSRDGGSLEAIMESAPATYRDESSSSCDSASTKSSSLRLIDHLNRVTE